MQALKQVLTVSLALVALIGQFGCGSSTGPAASRNNPGTGTNSLQVTADIDANDDPAVIGGFTTDYSVSLRDGAGNPVPGATVTISNPSLGTVTLPETGVGTGDYFKTGSTFPSGDFTLNVVKGPDNVKNVVLGGPGVHNITKPLANDNVLSTQPLAVRWTVPSRGQSAEVETRDFGPVALPDTGAYDVPVGSNPARPDQRVRVFRFNEVNISGGIAGSRLRVTVRKTVEPVVVQ